MSMFAFSWTDAFDWEMAGTTFGPRGQKREPRHWLLGLFCQLERTKISPSAWTVIFQPSFADHDAALAERHHVI